MRIPLKPAILAVVLALSATAQAAETSVEQAGTIKTALERYLGQGPVSVSPAGAAYKINIDLKATLHRLEALGLAMEPASYTMMAAPLEDGTWHVTGGTLPPLTAKLNGQTTSIVANGQSFDGIFDPRIPAFTKSTGSYDSVSIGTVGDKVATQARQLSQGQQSTSAVATGDGVVDAKLTQGNAAFSQDVALDAPKGASSRLSIKSGPTSDVTAVEGLHIRALADLWAFLVAHPSTAALKSSQGDLKSLLRQALPLFQHWAQDASLDRVSMETPVGPFAMRAVKVHFDVGGLTPDGMASLAVTTDGLTVPTDKLPSWAEALIPTSFDLHQAISGYHLDQAARAGVDGLDLSAPQPLSPETLTRIKELLGPTDKMVVSVGPSRITSSTFDARFEGEVHMTLPSPAFTMKVQATGFDKAIETIQAKAPQDPSASQVIAVLMLVKGYGKTAPDGSMTWALAGDGTGAITVNGVPLPFGQTK